jgi:RNA polymerase primary sigma factor
MSEIVSRWKATSMELNYRLGRQPTSAEVAEELELPESNWNVVRHTVQASIHPAHSTSDEASSAFADSVADTRTLSPEEQTLSAIELGRMRELLELLDSRESRILKLRFGIGTGTPMTLKAIGKRFGLTRERVRQMEQRALDKLGSIMSREFGEERTAARQRRGSAGDK